MPSVRSYLIAHAPLPVAQGKREGFVIIETRDIEELEELAEIESETSVEIDPDHVEISFEELQAMAQAAHNIIHKPMPSEVDKFLGSVFGQGDEDDEKNIERGYDEEQQRAMAMSFAAQITAVRLQSGAGLDNLSYSPDDVVTQAEKILDFLKGGK